MVAGTSGLAAGSLSTHLLADENPGSHDDASVASGDVGYLISHGVPLFGSTPTTTHSPVTLTGELSFGLELPTVSPPISTLVRAVIPRPRHPLRTRLLPHQAAGVARLRNHDRRLMLWSVGSGKTAMYAERAYELVRDDPFGRVLLICGAGRDVGLQLSAEFRRFAPELTVHSTAETNKLAPGGRRGYPPPFQVEITSKERLTSAIDGYESKRFRHVMIDEVGEYRTEGVELDAALRICDAAETVLAGTAYVYQNNPVEVWHALRLVCGPSFMSRSDFDDQFTIYAGGYWHERRRVMIPARPIDCADPEGLGTLIAQHADILHERDLPEVRKPAITRDVIWLPVDPADIVAYQSAGSLKGAERVAAGAGVETMLGLLDGKRQAIVFSEYVSVANGVHRRATDQGRSAFLLTGQSTDRKQVVADFRATPDGVLVGTRVLETGLNLQSASHLYSLGSSWTPTRELQREGRLRRMGSKHDKVHHTYLLADLPSERSRWATLARKLAVADSVMEFASGPDGNALAPLPDLDITDPD